MRILSQARPSLYVAPGRLPTAFRKVHTYIHTMDTCIRLATFTRIGCTSRSPNVHFGASAESGPCALCTQSEARRHNPIYHHTYIHERICDPLGKDNIPMKFNPSVHNAGRRNFLLRLSIYDTKSILPLLCRGCVPRSGLPRVFVQGLAYKRLVNTFFAGTHVPGKGADDCRRRTGPEAV
jgi:hypothetical protein